MRSPALGTIPPLLSQTKEALSQQEYAHTLALLGLPATAQCEPLFANQEVYQKFYETYVEQAAGSLEECRRKQINSHHESFARGPYAR